MRIMRPLILSLLLAASIPAADFFPLQTGNRWTYRAPQGWEFTVEVGTPVLVNEKEYYSVRGYGADRMYLRRGEDGALYALNTDTRDETLVASFGGDAKVPYPVQWSTCEQMAEPEERPVILDGPIGHYESGRAIRYFATSCRDAGLEQEVYLENIGLARRTMTTIAGPVTFDLVSARVGKSVIETRPHAEVKLRLNEVVFSNAPLQLRGELTLALNGAGPVQLVFPTTQRYDLVLRDASGRQVYKWSEDRMFLTVESSLTVAVEYRVTVEAQIPSLPEGRYSVEAWLTVAGVQPPAALASIEVKPAVN